jgi:hypothetical protein
MGNEALRSSRSAGASIFRRHSSRRRSAGSTGNGAPAVTAQDDENIGTLDLATPKPARRMDKIRRSLSFRLKKKSSSSTSNNNKNKKEPSGGRKAITESSSNNTTTNNNNNNNSNNESNSNNNTNNNSTNSSAPARPVLWVEDEKKVRAGNCSFQVKVSLKTY